jgi:hypothetical protein
MSDPVRWLAAGVIVGIIGVEYGGWALLTFVTGREGITAAQQRFFRDGHAHAGVLLVLSLSYLLFLDATDFSSAGKWIAGLVLALGVACQSGGFFVHMAAADKGSPSLGTRLTRTGALLIGAALIALAVGLAAA